MIRLQIFVHLLNSNFALFIIRQSFWRRLRVVPIFPRKVRGNRLQSASRRKNVPLVEVAFLAGRNSRTLACQPFGPNSRNSPRPPRVGAKILGWSSSESKTRWLPTSGKWCLHDLLYFWLISCTIFYHILNLMYSPFMFYVFVHKNHYSVFQLLVLNHVDRSTLEESVIMSCYIVS